MKNVALYARVSSEQQAQQATVDSQIAMLQERAKADGHLVLPSDTYVDDGYSGATLVRPALERLRDRAAEGAIDVLYVHNPDRLARRYAYQVLLLEDQLLLPALFHRLFVTVPHRPNVTASRFARCGGRS